MGQGSSKPHLLRKAVRDNEAALVDVILDGTQLSEKFVRKLCSALKRNR